MNRRLALLGVVVVAAAAVPAVASRLPLPQAGPVTPASGSRALPATGLAATPVCPGPETLLAPPGGRAVATGGTVAVAAAAQAATGADTPGRATLGGMLVPVAGGTGLLTLTRSQPGPVPLQVTNAPGTPLLSAVQLGLARSGELRGLTAVSCATAATQSWVVGGGTQAGRRERLLLANPSATPALVDVTVHGPDGPVDAPGGLGVVVPPGGEVALRVDALAPALSALAVHVQARTGRVSAVLQDDWVRGATPGGVDDVTAAAAPSRRQLVPGVAVPSGVDLPSDPAAVGAIAVRVLNPGTRDVVARVRLVGSQGEVTPKRSVLTVPAGGVRDLAVTDAPAGTYTAVVEADGAVVAGALVGVVGRAGAARAVQPQPQTQPSSPSSQPPSGPTPSPSAAPVAPSLPADLGAGTPSEFGLASSVDPVVAPVVVALPRLAENGRLVRVEGTLVLTAPDDVSTVEVVELDGAGKPTATRTVTLPAGTSAVQALDAGTQVVRLRPTTRGADSSGVVGALVLKVADSAGPLLSVLPVRPGASGAERPVAVPDPRVGLRA